MSEHHDLMEFLSVPFISNFFIIAAVRVKYEELIKDKQYNQRYNFERMAERFKDKISTDEYVRFRHPPSLKLFDSF
jgi:hypothetical protein